MSAVEIPGWVPEEDFGLRFRSYLAVPEDGVYTLRLTSDDGSMLRMGNRVVIDHDGPHGETTRQVDVAKVRATLQEQGAFLLD